MRDIHLIMIPAEGITLAKVREAKAQGRRDTAHHAIPPQVHVGCEVTQEMVQHARKWFDIYAYDLPREVIYALNVIYRMHDGRRLYLKNTGGNIGYEVAK